MEEIEMENNFNKGRILKMIIIILIIIVLILLYARFIATKGLVIKEYPIKTTKISNEYDGFKIIQFSDLHYGSTIGLKELKKIIKKINDQNPDIIVFTGDLVEMNVTLTDKEVKDVINELKKLDAKIEILSVKGNHDYDHDYYDNITKSLEWHLLDNTYEYIYNNSKVPMLFVGLDDLTEGNPDYDNAFSYLNETEEDLYTIVLAHEPDQIDEINNYDFDLMLSGHSHLGQVRLPLIGAIYTPVGSKKYYDEHYKVDNTDLYISGGIGTSTVKFRLFNKPSINLYRFYTKE